jgi:hypothetical protein
MLIIVVRNAGTKERKQRNRKNHRNRKGLLAKYRIRKYRM